MKHAFGILAAGAFAVALGACSNNKSTPSAPVSPTPTGGTQTFQQFERLSRPAVKELFERFVDHQISNAAEPYNDATLQASITTFTGAFRAPAYGTTLAAVLYPDEMAADLSDTTDTKAAYLGLETGGATGSKFGGRDLGDNVIDISLGAVFGSTLSALHLVTDDGKENNCLVSQNLSQNPSQKNTGSFPYLAPPH